MRKLLGTALAILIAAVGVVGLIAFFNSRDASTTGVGREVEPAARSTPAAPAGSLLRAGNVVLEYGDPRFAPRLRKLAESLGAPDRPELRATGQAVVLRRRDGAAGVRARAQGRELTVPGPEDPRLQPFVERWLGQGAAG